MLFLCFAALDIPVQDWSLRSPLPGVYACLEWAFLPLRNQLTIYQRYCRSGCSWSCVKFLRFRCRQKWRKNTTSRHSFSADLLWTPHGQHCDWGCSDIASHCPSTPMWLEKTVLELLILLETGASCVELRAEWIYLWLTTPSSQFMGFPNHLVFMADTFTPLCILYTRFSKCSSLSWFVSVSFSWVRSDPLKHGSPDSIINSQEVSRLQHPGELLGDEVLFLTLYCWIDSGSL